VLLLLSTSGRSSNLLRAADRAHECGLAVWALTGPGPNPLWQQADRAIQVAGRSTSAIQEAHLVIVHALCAAVERSLDAPRDDHVVDLRDHATALDGARPRRVRRSLAHWAAR
jgi:DNA-binding MurR/RpiR family transcriptional regulator